MKSKKLISLLCAAAMTVSSFAALSVTASAAVGDVLLAKQTFEETDWGVAARTNRFTVTYEALADKPSGVEGTKSLAVDSLEGNDGESKVSLPTVTTSSTGAYGIEFDTRLVSADYKTGQTQDETTQEWSKVERELGTGSENFKYAYGFGNETADSNGVVATYSDMFGIEVRGDSVYLRSGVGNVVDTGFDVPITGAWFHVAATADTASAKYKATITPYGESGALDTAKAVTKYSIDFPKQTATATTATTLTSMMLQSIRFDGPTKGLMQKVAIDNFVVTEANKIEAREVTINYVDASGNTIKTETDTAEEGVAYTVSDSKKVSFAADDGEHYYKYTDTGSTTTIASVAESGNVITLKFTTESLVDVTYNAVKPNGTLIKQLYTVKAIPATKVTYFNNIYIKEGNDYYKAKDTSNYKQEVTVGDSATTVTVVYKPADNVKYYKEAEEFTKEDGTLNEALQNTATFSGGIANRGPALSDGKNEGFETDPVPAAGDYDFTFVAHASKRGEFVSIVSEDGTVTNITDNYPNLTDGTDTKYFNAGTFTLPVTLAAGDKIRVWARTDGNNTWNSKAMNRIDYLLLTQGEASSVAPVAELAYDKTTKTATVSVNNIEEVGDDVEMAIIHASYKADKTLDKVEVFKATAAIAEKVGAVSKATATFTNPVAKGDKIMVWDSVKGMKPLVAAHDVTETEQDDGVVQPTPTTEVQPTPTTEVQPTPTTEVQPTPTTEVQPTPTTEVQPTPTTEVQPTPTTEVQPAPTKYTVTLGTVTNGTIDATPKTEVAEGAEVTVTVTPENGYELATLTYTKGSDAPVNIDKTTKKFNMPAGNVTINATFTEVPKTDLTGTPTITTPVVCSSAVTATYTKPQDALDVTYKWQKAETENGAYADIPGATSATYTPNTNDIGKYIRVAVSAAANDTKYTGTVYSAGAQVSAIAVTGTVSYTAGVTANEATEGTAVTASASLTPNDAVVTYKWQKSADGTSGWEDIASATRSSYTPAAADGYIRAVVTPRTDAGYSGDAINGAAVQVKAASKPLVNTVAQVAVSGGTTAGSNLTKAVSAKDGETFTETTAFTYKWYKDGAEVEESAVTNAPAGTYKVIATYNGSTYTGTLESAEVTLTKNTLPSTVTVTASATNSNKTPATLSAAVADSGSTGLTTDNFDITWTKDGAAYTGSTTDVGAGSYVATATVKDANGYYTGSVTSDPVVITDVSIAGTVAVKVDGTTAATGTVGAALTPDLTGLTVTASGYTYQWQKTTAADPQDADWTDAATTESYTPDAAGKFRVKVTANETGKTGTLTSSVVTLSPAAQIYQYKATATIDGTENVKVPVFVLY